MGPEAYQQIEVLCEAELLTRDAVICYSLLSSAYSYEGHLSAAKRLLRD